MTSPGLAAGPARQYLVSLRDALASRGVAAELHDGGWQEQLRPVIAVEESAERAGVTFAAGGWWFCWPQVTLISPVTPVTQAAEAILSELGLGGAQGRHAADLAVARALRRARESFLSAPVSQGGVSPPGRSGGEHRPPGRGEPAARQAGPWRDYRERLMSGHEPVAPGRALAMLRAELAARGVTVDGLTLTRWHGILTLASGPAVQYCHGWLFWAAGRPSRAGRPLCAIHHAADPAGAARRIAPPRPMRG